MTIPAAEGEAAAARDDAEAREVHPQLSGGLGRKSKSIGRDDAEAPWIRAVAWVRATAEAGGWKEAHCQEPAANEVELGALIWLVNDLRIFIKRCRQDNSPEDVLALLGAKLDEIKFNRSTDLDDEEAMIGEVDFRRMALPKCLRESLVGSASPVREPNEGAESWNARTRDHRDIERFESEVGKRLIAWNIQRHVRFHLEAPIEPDGKEPGVWVPVQIFASFEDAGVDPEGWEE